MSRKIPIKFEVPMIVNGHQLPINIGYKKVEIEMGAFKDRYLAPERIDIRPCYQRDPVWTLKQQRAFIQSCFNANMAIPPLYLAKKKSRSKAGMWVAIDGRQRITALDEFIAGLFWIKVKVTYSDNSVKTLRLTWADISENDDYIDLKDQFLNRKIDLVQFEQMDYTEQRKVFVALNHGTPLNADEENYCPNYLSRRALQEFFTMVFKSNAVVNYEHDEKEGQPGPGLASVLQTGVRNERRFSHLRVMHECLILTTGLAKKVKENPSDPDDFVLGKPQPRSCKRTDRQSSAEAIHASMMANGLDYDDSRPNEIIEFLGLNEQVALLRDVADQMAYIFDNNATLGRKPATRSESGYDKYCLPRQIIDALSFMYTIVHDGHWTVAKIKGMRSRLPKWLAKYYEMKTTLGDYNMATSDALTMAGKYRIMRLSFNKMFGENIPEWKEAESALSDDQKTVINEAVKGLRRLT